MDISKDHKFQFSRKAMLLFAELRLGLKQMDWPENEDYWESVYLTYGTIYSYFLELDEYFMKMKRRTQAEKIVYFNLGEMFMKYNRVLMSHIFSMLDEVYNEDEEDDGEDDDDVLDEDDIIYEEKLTLTEQYDRLLLMVEGINSVIDVDKIIMSEEIIDEIMADLQQLEISRPVSEIVCNYLDDINAFLDATSNLVKGEYE